MGNRVIPVLVLEDEVFGGVFDDLASKGTRIEKDVDEVFEIKGLRHVSFENIIMRRWQKDKIYVEKNEEKGGKSGDGGGMWDGGEREGLFMVWDRKLGNSDKYYWEYPGFTFYNWEFIFYSFSLWRGKTYLPLFPLYHYSYYISVS